MGIVSSVHRQRNNIIKNESVFITKHNLTIKNWGKDQIICCTYLHTDIIFSSNLVCTIPKNSKLYLKDIKKKTLWKINNGNNYEYVVEYNKKNYIISNSIIEFNKINYTINTKCLKKLK